MTWIDGILMVLVASASALVVAYRREAKAARTGETTARDELAAERTARDADRAAFDEERRLHLYDHRQLVSRRILLEGTPPLDEPLRVGGAEEDGETEYETLGEVEAALLNMEGGRHRAGGGPIAQRQEKYDRLLTLRDELRERGRRGTPHPNPREPQSPYTPRETPLTTDDYAAIDQASN